LEEILMTGRGPFRWFEERKEHGAVFVRVLIGLFLIWGVQDNVLSNARMLEFRDFLAQTGFPFPLFCAWLSAYAQLICGILYVVGWGVRPAAVVMIGNFIVAFFMVHRADTFQGAFPALMMLFGSVFLLFNGAGPLSVDRWRERRRLIS
jgi:putative oxidoreductase